MIVVDCDLKIENGKIKSYTQNYIKHLTKPIFLVNSGDVYFDLNFGSVFIDIVYSNMDEDYYKYVIDKFIKNINEKLEKYNVNIVDYEANIDRIKRYIDIKLVFSNGDVIETKL